MEERDQKTQRFIMKDLTGQRFGMLTALEALEERDLGRVVWKCQCECGNIVTRYSSQLRAGVKLSCGCVKPSSIRSRNDLTGKRFGSLTVIRPTEKRERGRIVWECHCDCGATSFVQSQYLTDGSTKCCPQCQKENRPHRDISGMRFGILTAMYPTEKRGRNQSVIWHCRCDCGNEVEHSCADLVRKNYISCGCLKHKAEAQLKDRTTHVAGTTVELLRTQKLRTDNSTGIRGVNKMRDKYQAKIHFQGKTYCLGTYYTIEEAAVARKAAEDCLYGGFLDFYDKWKNKADADPEWGKENPISVKVNKDGTGRFYVYLLPDLT